jgi:hypothetical protein
LDCISGKQNKNWRASMMNNPFMDMFNNFSSVMNSNNWMNNSFMDMNKMMNNNKAMENGQKAMNFIQQFNQLCSNHCQQIMKSQTEMTQGNFGLFMEMMKDMTNGTSADQFISKNNKNAQELYKNNSNSLKNMGDNVYKMFSEAFEIFNKNACDSMNDNCKDMENMVNTVKKKTG